MIYFVAYIASILIVNILFSYVPLVPTPIGLLSPVAVLVGTIFVLRDFTQRSIGHRVLWGVAIGAVLSYLLADPFVATASVLAFVASELSDWGMYTITKKPFYQRVWISSLVATPIDTLVFLLVINQMLPGTFILMVISKLIASAIIWYYGQRLRNRYLMVS